MATVKGDVHDIGKNIVAVVLGCNNYKVYDIGVMCSCEMILQKAKEYNVDVVGLSGLITPSLDEMVVVAKEMQKAGFKQPILIGGATTSKMHTAVKVAPNYFTLDHPVIHVLDASRSVTVVSSLLGENKEAYVTEIMEEYDEVILFLYSFCGHSLSACSDKRFVRPLQMREDYYAGLEDRYFLTFDQSKKQKLVIDFDATPPAPAPKTIGVTVIDNISLADVVPYMDWVSLNELFSCCVTELFFNYTLLQQHRILSSKRGNSEAVTRTEVIPKSLTIKLLVPKQRNYSMMPKI